MGRPRETLVGRQYSYLLVKQFAGVDKHSKSQWICQCVCGKEKVLTGNVLKQGDAKSCGCKRTEPTTKHGFATKHPYAERPYRIWQGMKQRCYYSKNKSYQNYGGRGIKVCDRWRESFVNFWSDMKNSYSDVLSLDRIDNDGNYELGNCRWATRREQALNKRRKAA